MHRTFDTFIFDLDGTLLDTVSDLVILTNETLREFDFPVRTKDEILSFIGDGLRVLLQRAAPEGASDEQIDRLHDCWQELYPRYGIAATEEFPGITEMLQELKERGKKLAVLSNKFDKGVSDLIPSSFPGIFDAYHGVSEAIPRKPDPAGLLSVINELEADSRTVAYVGDSVVDIEVAKAAKVASIAVTWGYQPKESLIAANPFALANTPQELLKFA